MDSIQSTPDWESLPESDKADLSAELSAISASSADDLAGIRSLLNSRLEADAAFNRIRSIVSSCARKHEEASRGKPVVEEPAGVEPRRVRFRHRYTASETAPLKKTVSELQEALSALQSGGAAEVLVEIDGAKYKAKN